MQAITDTVPASIFEGVTRYYERKGYFLKSWTLLSGDRYEMVFERP